MTKMLLAAFAAVTVQANATSALFFGADSASQNNNEFCNYTFSVPQVQAGPTAPPKTLAVVSALNAKWNASLATQIANWKTNSLQAECADYSSSYQENSAFTIATDLDSNIVSIVTTSSGYYGGAHGTYGESAETFNAKTGEFYTSLADFFDDTKKDVLLAKLREKLKEQNEGFDPEFGYNDWEKGITSLYSLSNYYFSDEGLVIYYNPYAVGSYAEGLIKAKFFWWELADLGLRKEGAAKDLKPISGL